MGAFASVDLRPEEVRELEDKTSCTLRRPRVSASPINPPRTLPPTHVVQCRHCGILVCGTCSTKRFPLAPAPPETADLAARVGRPLGAPAAAAPGASAAPPTPERVCDACFVKLGTLVELAAGAARRWEEEKAKATAGARNFADSRRWCRRRCTAAS